MAFDNFLGYREADASARILVNRIQPLKHPENPLLVAHVEANPVVPYDHGAVTIVLLLTFDPYLRWVFLSVLDGV